MFKRNKCRCATMMHGRMYYTIECKHCIKWYNKTVTRGVIVMDW